MADAAFPAQSIAMPKKNNAAKILIALLALLVIGVCCVTAVGALGYGASGSYVVRSRLVEPGLELGNLARSEESHCRDHGSYAPSAGPQPPVHGGTEHVPGDFANDPGFRALGHDATGPLYFSYSIVPGAADGHVELRAIGDADGDGETSTHTITCVADGCACADAPISSGDTDERLER